MVYGFVVFCLHNGQDAEKWIPLAATSVQQGGWETLFRNSFNYSPGVGDWEYNEVLDYINGVNRTH